MTTVNSNSTAAFTIITSNTGDTVAVNTELPVVNADAADLTNGGSNTVTTPTSSVFQVQLQQSNEQRYKEALGIYLKHTLNNKLSPIRTWTDIISDHAVEDILNTSLKIWVEKITNICNEGIRELNFIRPNNQTKLYFGMYGDTQDIEAIGYMGILGYGSTISAESPVVDKVHLASFIDTEALANDISESFLRINSICSGLTVSQILDNRDKKEEFPNEPNTLTDLNTEVVNLKAKIENAAKLLRL